MEKFDSLPANSVLHEIQLKLRGGLILADMILMGQRRDSRDVFIMLFDPKMSRDNKLVVYRYVKLCLQRYIDSIKV